MEKKTAIDLTDQVLINQGMKKIGLGTNKSTDAPALPTDTLYFDLRKGSLYLVNFIDGLRGEEIQRRNDYIREILEQNTIAADRVFILYLLLTDDMETDKWHVFPAPNLESDRIEVYWLLDSLNEKLFFPPDQPGSFLNLDRELVAALSGRPIEHYVMESDTRRSYISFGIIGLNVIIWLIQEVMGGSQQVEVLLQMGAMNPLLVQNGEWYRLLTAMFLHIGGMHLLMNSAGIYIFGSRLERQITVKEMIGIYLLGGLTGNLFSFGYHCLVENRMVVAAGASGGVYALMGALLGITYWTKRRVGGLDAYAIFIYVLIGFAGSAVHVQIDLAAHLGGFGIGFLLATLLLRKRKATVITTEK